MKKVMLFALGALSVFSLPRLGNAQTIPAITNAKISCSRVTVERFGRRDNLHVEVAAWWNVFDPLLMLDTPSVAWNAYWMDTSPAPYGTPNLLFGAIYHFPSHVVYDYVADYSINDSLVLARSRGRYELGVTLSSIYGSASTSVFCPTPGN